MYFPNFSFFPRKNITVNTRCASVIVDRNSSVFIDSGDIANCWKWEWLDEVDGNEDTSRCYIRKIEETGTALCIWCNKKVTYADRLVLYKTTFQHRNSQEG